MNLTAEPPSTRHTGGFTLLELLVAVALFTLILAAVLSGVQIGSRAWEAGEARSRANNDMRLVQELIRRHLSAAIPLFIQTSSKTELRFTGEDERVVLVTELAPRFGPIGLYEWEIGRGAGEAKDELRLAAKLIGPGSRDSEPLIDQSLVEGLSELGFDYFGTEGREPPRWYDEWPAKNRLPKLVRLRLATGGQAWPELVVRIRIDAERREQADRAEPEEEQPPPETSENDA